MYTWFARFTRDTNGNSAVEFALVLPVLLLAFVGLTEVGRAYYQADAIEKGLRAGALFAARSPSLSGPTMTAVENLVKTGSLNGVGPYLVSGWGKSGSDLQITSSDFSLDGEAIPVVRLSATVPFDPMLPGLAAFVGLENFNMTLSHEQAYLGD